MKFLSRFFVGHPLRVGVAAVLLVVAAGAGWYLGSPLFLKSYANEDLPTVSAGQPATGQRAPGGASAQPAPEQRLLSNGMLGFVDDLHFGTGEVRLLEVGSQKFLRFQDVAISNAPDIHVYLSRDTGGRYNEANSLYLGTLRATNGSFNYELPAGTDVSAYRSVVIWCRNFSTLITWADLR